MLHRTLATFLGAAALVAGSLLPARAVDVAAHESPGGIAFWLVEEPSIPIVSMEVTFRGGARLDPADRPGLARMMTTLLDEGAGERDAVAFAKARDELAVRFGAKADSDSIEVGVQMLAEEAEASAALVAEALAVPRFDAEAVERIRAQFLSMLAEQESRPNDVASKAWLARAFPDHPYGRPADGTIESVSAITREELAAAHRRLLTRANALVAVVGAVDAERAGRLVDILLGALPEGEPVPAVAPTAPPPPGLEVVELPVPQSAAIFGHAGLPREDPDFYAAFVMNYILGGGGLSSRLMEEVREKRGLAYGVYSYFSLRKGAPLYLGGVQTANARMAESLDVIRAEWARMAAEGVTAEDLAAAKTYLTGSFPLRFDSNAKIARFLVFVQEHDLGIDYVNRRNALIEAVTLEDVNRVAARLLKPEALSVVVVGQPAGL
ncbi:pitrilysin family protein [Paralimibaculum aggregatum]|uniref:Pitrilysin family protein n=1 Tax=Paralimibaculum aggregatum TaxID=3036245 RepID=A0ABQ6LFW3_9RHOB|nr:pitrilysin family protein [Limibaculum sp. NKW23]GMG82219.1 pitrilysin family protein [Limibaculum sp. NKW23]